MSPLLVAVLLHAAPLCADRQACFAPQPRGGRVQVNGATGAPDPLGDGHWLVDEENDEVLHLAASGRVERFSPGRWPEQLVLTRDGRTIVSCRESSQLAFIARDGRIRHADAGAEPKALALDESARRLYVALVTAREVVAFDLDSLEPVARAALPYEPTALALSSGALVAASRKSSELIVLDAATLAERWRVVVPNRGTQVARVQALLTLGDDVFVAARLSESGISQPPAPVEGGGYGGPRTFQPFDVTLFAVRSVDREYRPPELLGSLGLAEVDASIAAGGRLMFSSRGQRRLAFADAVAVRAPVPLSEETWAPAVVAMSAGDDGSVAYLDAHERRAIVSGAWGRHARAVAVPQSQLDDELRLGRELFHAVGDRRLSSRAMSCASCHPDGREDGLVWRLQGTARQTPMLAGGRLHETAPFNWLGTAPTLEDNLKQTVGQRLMGLGLDERELKALSRYVRDGLRPVRVGPPADPVRIARGRELFADSRVGCASCHPADLAFTDGAAHDVASMGSSEQPKTPRTLRSPGAADVPNPELLGGAYDTPSLIGLAVTAPYFHDGAARTLEEVVAGNHDRMGNTEHLSAEDRAALVAYLSTL